MLLAGAVATLLGRAGMWGRSLPEWMFGAGAWTLAAVLAAGAVLNATAGTIIEVAVIAPFIAFLAALCALLAASERESSSDQSAPVW